MKVQMQTCNDCKRNNELGEKTLRTNEGKVICRYCGSTNLGEVHIARIKRKK